jgi:carboxylesterase
VPVAAIVLALGVGCRSDLIFRDADLLLDDRSVHDVPTLVSERVPPPSPAECAEAIAVLVHGFGATTFELRPVAEDLTAHGILASQVLLAGHGTTVRDQASRTYEGWAEPIGTEVAQLGELGCDQVTIVAASMGAALVLDLLARGELEPPPRRYVFVSPLVEFADRRMEFLPLFALAGIKGSRVAWEGAATGHWYRTRPVAALAELRRLTARNRAALERGIPLAPDSRVLVIHAEGDRTVSGRGLERLERGLSGARVEVLRVPTSIHVPVKPAGCDRPWTAEEVAIQRDLLARIRAFVRD